MSSNDQSLLRILCFHGAGSSGAIFRAQGRKLFRALHKEFRFIFLDAPFPSLAGPGMRPTYEDSGPFYHWQCDDLAAENFDITEEEVQQEREQVRQYLESQLRLEDGAPFVGILGFSQGVRVASGLLHYLERKRQEGCLDLPEMKFAVINSGTYPPLFLDGDAVNLDESAEGSSTKSTDSTETATSAGSRKNRRLNVPSIHPHGSHDPWRPESEKLLADYYDTGLSTVIEYTGGHQVPVMDKDTKNVVTAIRQLAAKASIETP